MRGVKVAVSFGEGRVKVAVGEGEIFWWNI
jgi:hypothetical protein